eukprot:6191449-Pleurochrysis_carterae.AAC.2
MDDCAHSATAVTLAAVTGIESGQRRMALPMALHPVGVAASRHMAFHASRTASVHFAAAPPSTEASSVTVLPKESVS